ncbi:MAG: ATP-binding cassette domain-containing protein [Alphaproteobacteria bacterium]|nr:ATP-binding cassette domain-containing protein [Alphaproteobacteria bacterium]
MTEPLLSLTNVTKHFPVKEGLFIKKTVGRVKAVEDVSVEVFEGETLGLAGESGCGKSTTAKLVLLIDEPTRGELQFNGKTTQRFSKAELKAYRKSVQAVLQDPYSSLSPRMKVWEIVGEPLLVNENMSRRAVRESVKELLHLVGLPPGAADLYPHEFSGGQRQRIAIARALSLKPKLLVLDEPVSALDVSIRAQIMNLLRDLQRDLGLTYLLIAHDLATLRHMCDRIGIMYLGEIVELASGENLYTQPSHPYTQALLAAVLPTDPDEEWAAAPMSGEIPSPLNPPSGCRFHTRCPKAMAVCSQNKPVNHEIAPRHFVSCHLYA